MNDFASMDADPAATVDVKKRPRKLLSRVTMLLRRLHLYAGLFLLPWVFLYGITGAMYNHQGLFPEVTILPVAAERLADTPLSSFPTADALAERVVASLQESAPDSTISLAENSGAEYNNDVILEVHASGKKHVVHINPVSHSAKVVIPPEKQEPLQPLLEDVRNIQLPENPYTLARQSVGEILEEAGIPSAGSPTPLGWCKLNFLANIDGQQARVTYVLRDGHVDITRYQSKDSMTPRQFFLRLHTSHGQPPHWNGRMFWSLILDTMAIAMVTWGLTGLVMWWQIKRTRWIGSLVILTSLGTACWLYLAMQHFYATTKL